MLDRKLCRKSCKKHCLIHVMHLINVYFEACRMFDKVFDKKLS